MLQNLSRSFVIQLNPSSKKRKVEIDLPDRGYPTQVPQFLRQNHNAALDLL